MKETRYFFVPELAVAEQRDSVTELPEEEASHAVRVLRLQPGDEMMLMDGQGMFYRAEVTVATSKRCAFRILEEQPQEPAWKGHLHLAMAPTKMMDRVEWLCEKATEVGLDELTLLDCQFSERRIVKLPRIEKIVVSAVKQSRKAWMPVLHDMTAFSRFLAEHPAGHRYIAHCYDEVPRVNLFDELRKVDDESEIIVMIGPEGDFSIDEVRQAVDAGFVSVDLGKSRLRTETAALSAVMMMQLAQQ